MLSIEGPMLGVPLIFEPAGDRSVAGVIVLWKVQETEAQRKARREMPAKLVQQQLQTLQHRARLAITLRHPDGEDDLE